MNQGTRRILLMQKIRHRKSHAWAPLSSYAEAHKVFKFSSLFRTQIEAAHNAFKVAPFVS
jgi:hypothetical protein